MAAYESYTARIVSDATLLMHNGQTVDPLNYFTQRLAEYTGKRKKTEADLIEISKREFEAGLYLMNGAPCITGDMLEAALIRGAMKSKMGNQAKSGLMVDRDFALEYEGSRDPAELWNNPEFVFKVPAVVNRQKIMRTRPRFKKWEAEIEIKFLPDILNRKSVADFLIVAGSQIGLGDWRPRHGRFRVA